VIILLAVWNAITLPFSFAYPAIIESNRNFAISEHIIDSLFGLDVIINFRTGYRDSQTDELIMDER
jgi:hypothetical protein